MCGTDRFLRQGQLENYAILNSQDDLRPEI